MTGMPVFKVQEHTEAQKDRTKRVCRKGESTYYHRNKEKARPQRGTNSLHQILQKQVT